MTREISPVSSASVGGAASGRLRRNRMRELLSSQATYFVLPSALALLLVMALPLLFSLYYSFSGWVLVRPFTRNIFVGFANYAAILTDPQFWAAIEVTAEYAVACVCLQTLIGFGLALLFNLDFPGRGIYRSLMLLPMVITPAVVAIFWKLLYQVDGGIYNYFLQGIGLPAIPWLNAQWALISVIIMDTWQSSPFFMLVILAGLQSLDQSAVSAARLDGASSLQVTRYLTLPHLVPYVLIAAAFRSIDVLAEFDKMFLLTLGGPGNATTSVSLYAYNTGFRVFDMGRTTAAAWVIAIITLLVTMPLIIFLFRSSGERE